MSNSHHKLEALLASGKVTPEQYEEMSAALAGTERRGTDTNAGPSPRTSLEWMLMIATFGALALILLLFTPYTHQLDEIKTTLLYVVPPVLLLLALRDLDVTRLAWSRCVPLGLLGLFTLSTAVSMFLGDVSWRLAERLLWFQVACFTFTVVLALNLNTRDRIRAAFLVFTGLGFAASLIGLAMYTGALEPLHQIMKSAVSGSAAGWTTLVFVLSNNPAMHSTVLNSDFFALFLLMFLFVPFSVFLTEERRFLRIGALVTFWMMALSLLLTRSLFVIAAAAVITLPVYLTASFRFTAAVDGGRRIRTRLWRGAIAAGVFLIATPFALAQGAARGLAITDAYQILWSGAVKIWLHGPAGTGSLNPSSILFGAGPGGFRTHFPAVRSPDYFDYQINNVTSWSHNFYLDLLCEHGLVGLALFALLIGAVVMRAIRQMTATPEPRMRFYQLALLGGIAGTLAALAFTPALHWSVAAAFFWSLIGLSLATTWVGTRQSAVVISDSRGSAWGRNLAFQGSMAALAFLFLYRSVPQGVLYFQAAVENQRGLRALDYAEVGNGAEREQRLRQSVGFFENVARLNPTFTTSYYKLAHVHAQLGNHDAAISTYRTLQSLEPHYSEVHQNLGLLYAQKARETTGTARLRALEAAADEIRIAARQSLKPNVQLTSGVIVRELADQVIVNGDPERASALYEEAGHYFRRVIAFEPKTDHLREERDRYLERARQGLQELEELPAGRS